MNEGENKMPKGDGTGPVRNYLNSENGFANINNSPRFARRLFGRGMGRRFGCRGRFGCLEPGIQINEENKQFEEKNKIAIEEEKKYLKQEAEIINKRLEELNQLQ